MNKTTSAHDTTHRGAGSRAVNPYTPAQLAAAAPAPEAAESRPPRRTIIAGRYSVAGQGRMLSGVTHKAIQSYLSDSWDTVSPDERERLHQLLPDLDALCGFSPEGRGRISEVRRAWGVTEPFLTAGGDQVGWMIDISERLSVWLAPISAAHADESNDEDDVSLSTWTQAVRQVLRTGHDMYLGPFSRVGRRKDQLMSISATARRAGARIRTAEYQFDWRPEKPDVAGINDLLWTQFAQMQENEWRAILERTFAGRVLAMSDGRIPTHSPCWGWRKDPRTDKPVLDEDDVAVLRQALKVAAQYGPDQVDELFDEWHRLGVRPRRDQPRDLGRTILDIQPPHRVRYVRSRLADLVTWETGQARLYAPTVLTDLELVHGVELLPDVNDPRRRIVWFDIPHPLPQEPIVEPEVATRLRQLWEPPACGSCYHCHRRRWCQGLTGQTRNEWFGYLSHWTDPETDREYRLTLHEGRNIRAAGISLLSRPAKSDAVWKVGSGYANGATRVARVPNLEFCQRLYEAITDLTGNPLELTDQARKAPELAEVRHRMRDLANEIEQLRAPLRLLSGPARATVEDAIRNEVTAKEAELASLQERTDAAYSSRAEVTADVTGLVATLDALDCGEVRTPKTTTALIRSTVRDVRASLADDNQTVHFSATLSVPGQRGTESVLTETIRWSCRNATSAAQVRRSKKRENLLIEYVLREGLSLPQAAAAAGVNPGTATNKLSGVLSTVLPNAQARGAIVRTPYLPSRHLVADLIEGREVSGPQWLQDSFNATYRAPGGPEAQCPSTWVAKGHPWRRELQAHLLAAGRPLQTSELSPVPWTTFQWARTKLDQACRPFASWPAIMVKAGVGPGRGAPPTWSLVACPHCREPFDLLLNVPELPSPLVCTRCRTCADHTFTVPDVLLQPWDFVKGDYLPRVATPSRPKLGTPS